MEKQTKISFSDPEENYIKITTKMVFHFLWKIFQFLITYSYSDIYILHMVTIYV